MSKSKKRQADDSKPIRRANKRRAATGRVTRSAHKKRNPGDRSAAPFNPSLPMGEVSRRKRAASTLNGFATMTTAALGAAPLVATLDGHPRGSCESGSGSRDEARAGPSRSGAAPGILIRPGEQWEGLVVPSMLEASSACAEEPRAPAPCAPRCIGREKPPAISERSGPKKLRTWSDASSSGSSASPLTGLPHPGHPSLYPSALPPSHGSNEYEMNNSTDWDKALPTPDNLFDPLWCFPKAATTGHTAAEETREQLEAEEDDSSPAIVMASYSLSPEDALEVMDNERILLAQEDQTESIVIEVACSPVSDRGSAGANIEHELSNGLTPYCLEDEPSEETVLEETNMMSPAEHPSVSSPWPYRRQMSNLLMDENQCSVETYNEDSVIY